jgi:hypothetical protein
MEKRDRDDEEEWGRIPIPQSDDSDDEPWLDESHSSELEQEEEGVTLDTPATGKEKFSQNALMIGNSNIYVNKESTEDFAFRNGPRRDGIIRRKDGSLIITDDSLHTEPSQFKKPLKKENELPAKGIAAPRWSPLLLVLQHRKLRMKYKAKTKVRAQLMRSIRKHIPKKKHVRWKKENTVTKNKLRKLLSLFPSNLTQWDTTQGFTNQTYTEGGVIAQCMNAIRSPNRDTQKTKRMLKLPIHSKLAKRSRPAFSPITVPGTPENQQYKNKFEIAEEKQDEDLDLYYKIYARYKLEMGESNAESVERTDAIEAEYKLRMNLKKADGKEEKRVNKTKHYPHFSPSNQLQGLGL